ncbi:MAG TPA: phospholipid carrier-dependent glycosyltransferase [Actinomycetota bacterium]|nr:phospholipid carrier-dependent glycosyltransferase [Actinomycetota bacterium]
MDTFAVVGVTLLAGVVRFLRLSTPGRVVFDEVYYAQDACVFVRGGGGVCTIASPLADEHPHLAKWLIAGGIELFGYTPFGWRMAPALIGTLGVALLYVLARRLLGSTLAATFAAGLLAVDLLWFVQSRVAMLDVFVATFVLAAVLFVVVDRDRADADPASRDRERIRDRPWLLAGGLAAGAATASKWSGIWFWALVVTVPFAWDAARRRGEVDGGGYAAVWRATWRMRLWSLVVLPGILYVASFGNRFPGGLLVPPWSHDSWWWDFAQRQKMMLTFHLQLEGTPFPWTSPAWAWPVVKRPVVFAFEQDGGRFVEVLALGNPLVWIPALVAVVVLAVRWARRRDMSQPEGVIVAGFAAAYVPWLVLTQQRSFVFIFYLLPAVPFLVLALVRLGQRLVVGRRWAVAVVAVYLPVIVALFAWFYPIAAWVPLEPDAWQARMWFRDCRAELLTGDPPHPSFVPGPPPDGWCWI